MVGLLTRLGLDTGYTEGQIEGIYSGLEIMAGSKWTRRSRRRLWRREGIDNSPRVVKHPFGMETRPHLLNWRDKLGWDVERVIVMVRDIEVTGRHREEAAGKGRFDLSHHDTMLRVFLHEAVRNEWPVHFVSFPRAVQDVKYCWGQLQPLSREFEQFKSVWERHVHPEEIHE